MFGGASNNATTSTGFSGGFGATNNPGIGANLGDPPGTNNTPFQAHTEKETGNAGSQTNSFQNILFQEPYKKWSAEELRLADYNQGRRYGNASGGGAFGVSNFGSSGFGSGTQQQTSAFGGGSNNTGGGGLFGSANNNNTTTSGFGAASNTGGFGANNNTGGGLFGSQNKPATGGLFGNNSTTQQPAQSGGLFGSNNTTTGFGTTGTTTGFGNNASSGGGLFGSNNTQNKPSGFSFGNNNTTGSGFGAANTGSAFGATSGNANNNTTGGGLFGNSTAQTGGGGLFGNNNNNTNQQQQQNTGTSGGFGTGTFGTQNQQSGGLFGGNQQKPAGGLFGSNTTTNTTGGLFGNTNNNNTTSTGFGATNNTSTGGGLFGQKPAGTGTGLFGTANNTAQNTATNTGTGTGLFGGLGSNNQTQQTNQGGLFGSAGQNQAKPGGLFGSSQQSGGGLFGSQPTQQQGSLFGNAGNQQQQQQQQGSMLGGSLLGSSQSTNNLQQSLTASINDLSAYGNSSLFSNLGGNDTPNPGPLATPLSSKTKTRRSSILPMYKLNPASASRFVTPQKQRGFGFSYSTYGSPGTPSSATSTPGSMGRSMLGSSLSRGLSKSVSSSSLRKSYSAEDSILAPGAFSASSNSRYYGNTGSVRKLIINKEMRSDLFSTPTKEKPAIEQANGNRKLSKRVSFDTSNVDALDNGSNENAENAGTADAQQSHSNDSLAGPPATTDESMALTPSAQGKELAIVHEEDAAQTPRASSESQDKTPGEYWMSPTQNAIAGMNRVQRQSVENFTVGRDNVGYVRFRVPVDLSNIDLDDIFGNIVVLETRSATVYPNAAKKPPVGKGLNVPANISLEQSWPRGRDKRPTGDSRRLAKHVERLRRIVDTTFVDYNQDSGIWKFNVEHFTTYGLDYEEESDAEHHPEPVQTPRAANPTESPQSASSREPSGAADDDDTFDFRRKRRALPGAFDLRDPDYVDDSGATSGNPSESFLGSRFAGSMSNALVLSTEEEMASDDNEYDMSEDGAAAGASPGQHLAVERLESPMEETPGSPVAETPGGILRARMRAAKGSATPVRLQVADGDEWMDMLHKSVSPQKRDRALLRSTLQRSTEDEKVPSMTTSNRVVSDGRGFATSIDLMNSLFEKAKAPVPAKTGGSVGFVQVGTRVPV